MFVNQDELMDIILHYKKVVKSYLVFNDFDFASSKLTEEEKKKYQTVTFRMKQLTWGLHNELQEAAYIKDINGDRVFNLKVYKENRLKTLIVSWDAKRKNAKGDMEPVAISSESIMSLSPDIAEEVLKTYDRINIMDVDEEKK
jgi:hypothetical protein